ncbi:hypothetical protein SELMODRAFT_412463 [Selaginella moellendorffii]|uniref:Uncharacterized protein n=1 Tax=Selaginella moellendorffii TaxID=88036 RepID=D8RLK1_SELML|nr:hypothetical protein SELMODRAFT_412463 [Selaginella moellendorffii]
MPQENLQSYKRYVSLLSFASLKIRPEQGLEERDGKRGLEEREEQGLGLEQRVEHVEGLLQQEEEQVEGLEGDQGLEAKGLESDGAEKQREEEQVQDLEGDQGLEAKGLESDGAEKQREEEQFKTSRAIKGWKLMEQRFMAQEGVLTLSKDTEWSINR